MSMQSDDDQDPTSHRAWLKSREADQLKRQWKNIDGPGGVTDAYREGWDRIFSTKEADKEPRWKCDFCGLYKNYLILGNMSKVSICLDCHSRVP